MRKTIQILLLAVLAIINLRPYAWADNNDLQRAKENMDFLCDRLSSNNVSDKQIQDTVNNLVFRDKNKNKSVSLSYISNLTKNLKNRPLVASWLHLYSGRLNRSMKNEKIALEHFVASTNLLDSLYADVTVQRQESLLELGSSYYRLGDKENADKAFLAAYSFPYWTFPRISLDSKRRVEIVYRRSIMGLIMARAGNLQKLKEIRIIPAAKDLRPKLDAAIKKAEGKMDE